MFVCPGLVRVLPVAQAYGCLVLWGTFGGLCGFPVVQFLANENAYSAEKALFVCEHALFESVCVRIAKH